MAAIAYRTQLQNIDVNLKSLSFAGVVLQCRWHVGAMFAPRVEFEQPIRTGCLDVPQSTNWDLSMVWSFVCPHHHSSPGARTHRDERKSKVWKSKPWARNQWLMKNGEAVSVSAFSSAGSPDFGCMIIPVAQLLQGGLAGSDGSRSPAFLDHRYRPRRSLEKGQRGDMLAYHPDYPFG